MTMAQVFLRVSSIFPQIMIPPFFVDNFTMLPQVRLSRAKYGMTDELERTWKVAVMA
jgi:hypothetical protein